MLLFADKNKGFEWLSETQSYSASVLAVQNLIIKVTMISFEEKIS
jgi:hypothetical protein